MDSDVKISLQITYRTALAAAIRSMSSLILDIQTNPHLTWQNRYDKLDLLNDYLATAKRATIFFLNTENKIQTYAPPKLSVPFKPTDSK